MGEDLFWLRTATSLSWDFFIFLGKGKKVFRCLCIASSSVPPFDHFLPLPLLIRITSEPTSAIFDSISTSTTKFSRFPLPFASAFACFVSPVHSRRRQTAAKRTASISTTAVNIRHRHLDQVGNVGVVNIQKREGGRPGTIKEQLDIKGSGGLIFVNFLSS